MLAIMPSLQLKAINQLSKAPKLIVTDTMNYWMDNCLDDLLLVIKTNVLIINDEEAVQLSKKKNLMRLHLKF